MAVPLAIGPRERKVSPMSLNSFNGPFHADKNLSLV